MSAGSPFLYPNVTQLPSQTGRVDSAQRKQGKVEAGEFDKVLENVKPKKSLGELAQSQSIGSPIKFSSHASERLRERNIALDPQTLTKVRDAVDKAASKGIQESLVLTSDAAFIVNVANRTVVTALDRNALSGNIFTNIDGAIVV